MKDHNKNMSYQTHSVILSELGEYYARWVLPLSVEIGKIIKFFGESEYISVVLSPYDIYFFDSSKEKILFSASISRNDIYQYKCVDASWKGTVRQFYFPALKEMMQSVSKDSNKYFISLSLKKDDNDRFSELRVEILKSENKVSYTAKDITLSEPENIKETPEIRFANAVIPIQEFKALCVSIYKRKKKAPSLVRCFYQNDYIRFENESLPSPVEFGILDSNKPVKDVYVEDDVFTKATHMNMGNIKNGHVGIYLQDEYPITFKVKLGSVDFNIYYEIFNLDRK